MKIKSRHLLLALTVSSIFTAGCSTSRNTITDGRTATTIDYHSNKALPIDDKSSSVEFGADSRTVPVVHHVDEADGDSSDNVIQQTVMSMPRYFDSNSGMTLEDIEQLAMSNNPAIQQVTAAAARAGGIRTQVGLKPNPTFGYNGAQLADAGTDQHSLFVEQTFVRGDKLSWNQQVIDHDVNTMNWLVETQRQRLRTDIRIAFYETLAAQKRLKLSREFQIVARKGVNVSEERIKAEVGTMPDLLQSEIQLNEVELAIRKSEFEYSAARKELAALAGVPDLGQVTLIGNLDPGEVVRNAESEFAQIVATSPLLAAARARVDRARSNLQRQRAQPISNVSAQLGVGHDNGTGQEFVNMQLSLPLSVHNKNQGNIRAAHAEYCEATQNVERIRMSIRHDLARTMREYQVAEETVRLYRDAILPKTNEAFEMMQEGQAVGEFDFLRVLTARRAYFEANIRYVAALGQLAEANAKIDGLLLTGGLSNITTYEGDDSLRGQALSGQ